MPNPTINPTPNATLIATVTDRRSADAASRDYFAEYAELSSEQESISKLMRGNRAPFLS
jgi:hypothetical protein